MNWTSYKPVVYRDKLFGQKDLELMRFLDLPKRVSPVPIEISMPTLIHARWESPSQENTRAIILETPLSVRTTFFATTVGMFWTQLRYVVIFLATENILSPPRPNGASRKTAM